MKISYQKTIASILAMLVLGCTAKKEEEPSETTQEEPLSIIFMIGDGMGIPQVSSAYYFGEGTPNFSRFTHIGLHKTSDKSSKITDSAAGATAFSTGQKTYKRAIGVSVDSIPQETILEQLQKEGYQTGLISLTSITHATPASFYAHVKDRDMHEEIAAQLVKSKVDFFAGGGKKFFNQRKDGKDLFQYLVDENYHLDTLQLSNPVLDRPNAYVLAEDGVPSKIEGRGDFLKDATEMALDHFDQKGKPFFLMVEGSYIDWGGHAEDADMMVTEVLDFDKTLGTVLDYVKEHPNTLLVVTADHETGGVSIGKYYEVDESTGNKMEVADKVAVYFNSNQHSGELIPVFAEGKGAENFQGIYENNEIYHKFLQSLNQNKQ
ncbi:alkaline phosphatase [Flagellimonas aequoris]|uniref:Alkaline phosphatase n=1 Tax=Flagellimonas aequoris TaxID=2306997 RepID=A0A418N2S8_9FLAO|nr:alkaline phosphatase [Allomuricauda aequoris]RIV67623.1 alkaline phosphatase [Allomuricauda aequoris]TXJ99448.1 alkaline phosphatase [Allomuricauda aequoris]